MSTVCVHLHLWSYSEHTIEPLWGHKWPQTPYLTLGQHIVFCGDQLNSPEPPHQCTDASPKLNVTLLQHSLDAGTHFLLLGPPVVPPGCHCGFIYKNFLLANEDKNVNVTVTADIQFPASVGLCRPAEAPQQQQNNTRPGWRAAICWQFMNKLIFYLWPELLKHCPFPSEIQCWISKSWGKTHKVQV